MGDDGGVGVFVRCCCCFMPGAVQDLCMTDSYHVAAVAVARKPHEPSTQRPQPSGRVPASSHQNGSLWCTVPCIVRTVDQRIWNRVSRSSPTSLRPNNAIHHHARLDINRV